MSILHEWDLGMNVNGYICLSHLEVDPVDGVADVLEHALVGHEEVAILKASFTAGGEEQRHTRTQPSHRPHLNRTFSKT